MSLAVMLAAGCCHSTCVMCLLRCTCGMWWSSALVARRCSAVAASLRRCSAVYPLCHACYSLQCAACWIACCSVINSNRLSLRTLASYFPAQYILALVCIYVIVLEWLIVLIQCSSVRCAFLTRATTFFFCKMRRYAMYVPCVCLITSLRAYLVSYFTVQISLSAPEDLRASVSVCAPWTCRPWLTACRLLSVVLCR